MEFISFPFSLDSLETIKNSIGNFENRPVVYFLVGAKSFYVGETTRVLSRMRSHLKQKSKCGFSTIYLILEDKLNKSAALDYESKLIRYISPIFDGKFMNGNLGIVNHDYYQKEVLYDGLFQDCWGSIKDEFSFKKTLSEIENMDFFKFSPYKSLNEDQFEALGDILDFILSDDSSQVVRGGAGTGKSILAIYLIKLLADSRDEIEAFNTELSHEILMKIEAVRTRYPDGIRAAIVVPVAPLKETLKKAFRKISGLSADMVLAPVDVSRSQEPYDILVVDEAHRLKRRTKITGYKAFDDALIRSGLTVGLHDELDILNVKSKKKVLFYDHAQTVKASDLPKERFEKLMVERSPLSLLQQLRVQGGEDFIKFVHDFFDGNIKGSGNYQFEEYDFKIFDDVNEMVEAIKERDEDYGLCRTVAGFAWPWNKTDKEVKDISIGGYGFKWNTTNIDWVNSKDAVNEIGCIHTLQGYDLNYVGLIIGPDLQYSKQAGRVEAVSDNFKDTKAKPIVGADEGVTLDEVVKNAYKTLMLRGMKGAYIYCVDRELSEYLKDGLAN